MEALNALVATPLRLLCLGLEFFHPTLERLLAPLAAAADFFIPFSVHEPHPPSWYPLVGLLYPAGERPQPGCPSSRDEPLDVVECEFFCYRGLYPAGFGQNLSTTVLAEWLRQAWNFSPSRG
jgi:hypothetical protein